MPRFQSHIPNIWHRLLTGAMLLVVAALCGGANAVLYGLLVWIVFALERILQALRPKP